MSSQGKSIICEAAVAWEVNKPVSVETVVVAPPKAGEVRVKMTSTGVCHSDLHILEGMDPNWSFPQILGHEGAGIVESIGEGVTGLAPGDLVVLVFEGYCGECDFCKNPNASLCQKQPRNNLQMDGTARVTCKGKDVTQMMTLGTFSEYVVTSQNNVAKVNQKAPANILGLVGCCIPTGYGAAMSAAQVKPGSTCAIWGLGGVGMCVVMGCRDSKASKIIGIDLNPHKFPLAKELGCTDVVNPKELTKSVPETLAEMTNGGVDYCFVSVGIISAMEEAFQSSHPAWGETIIIGLSDMGRTMNVGVWDLLLGRKLRSTYYGTAKPKLRIPQLVDKIVEGKIQLDKLISHVITLTKINDAFDMLKTGKSLRTIIDYSKKE